MLLHLAVDGVTGSFDLLFDDPPMEDSFDFFRRVLLGMSGRFCCNSLPWLKSVACCRAPLVLPSHVSLVLEALLVCFGLSDFSILGESVPPPPPPPCPLDD